MPSARVDHGDEIRPDIATTGLSHSSLKFAAKSAAMSPDSTVTMTFSSRLHESLVQLVEPVSTAGAGMPASRTTYLWCIRSGTPGTGLICTPAERSRSTNAQSISGGGGTGIASAWSWLKMRRTATPRLTADSKELNTMAEGD